LYRAPEIQSKKKDLKEICLSVTVREMKRKTTVYLEDDVLKTMRVAAVRSGKRDYQVVEEALRAYLGLELPRAGWSAVVAW